MRSNVLPDSVPKRDDDDPSEVPRASMYTWNLPSRSTAFSSVTLSIVVVVVSVKLTG